MCTRFQLSQEHYRQLLRELGVAAPAEFATRYNIAPTSRLPAVRQAALTAGRELASLRWGLTPAWAKSDEPASRLVNARAETLAAKPSFRDALRSRRCVIPASGFYEWETTPRGKQPWLFRRRDGQPFGFAGLWETWRAPNGGHIESFAVVTTTPNELLQRIHDRMPVLLTPDQCGTWLDPAVTRSEDLTPLLQPLAADLMSAQAVSTFVSNVRHEGPACIAPADEANGAGRATGAAADPDSQLSLGF